MSNFYTLELARKTMFASQKALDVTGHNIANANTEGYTRQVVSFTEIKSTSGFSNDPASNIGGGVKIQDITQVRNPYFDDVYREENALYNELETKATSYKYIEDILGEGSDTSIISSLQDVFNAMDELSQNAGDALLRGQLKQSMLTLTNNIHLTDSQLRDYRTELNGNVKGIMDEINQMGEDIRDLNEMIYQYELTGNRANDLRDQRNLLVDKLSGYVDINVSENTDGHYRVDVNGHPIVEHMNNYELKLKDDVIDTSTGEKFSSVYWGDTNTPIALTGGKLKATLELRDSMNEDSPGVTFYIKQLDNLAEAIVTKFNAVNQQGYTLCDENFTPGSSKQGVNIFDDTKIEARNITLSQDILDNIQNFATSDKEVTKYENTSNNNNLLEMLKLRGDGGLTLNNGTDIIGDFETMMQTITTDIAVTAHYNEDRAVNQSEMVSFITDQKLSTSAVSIDEEAINMIKYQRTFEAASKLIITVDEMMQTLLNMV